MNQPIIKVLAVDKDKKSLASIKKAFPDEKYEVFTASSESEVKETINDNPIELIITDYKVSGVSGLKIIETGREKIPDIAGILILGSKQKKEKDVIDAFADGRLSYYITGPIDEKEILRYAELALRDKSGVKTDSSSAGTQATADLEELKKELDGAKEKIAAYTKKIGILTLTDADTKLYNRKYFEERLHNEFERSVRYNSSISLIALNIDDFKKINELYGSAFGDGIIREIGAMLKGIRRNSDVVARFGGVEFAVLLPEIEIDNAKVVAERFRQSVESKDMVIDGRSVRVTSSCGVAGFPGQDINSPKDLMQKANQALQHAIGIGRNRVVVQTKLGMIAVGEGETVTSEEKAVIKKAIADFAASSANLEEMCSFLLSEINRYFARDPKPFYGAMYVVQESGHLRLVSSFGTLARPVDVENLTRNAAYSGMAMVTRPGDREHPFSTFPILGTARSLNKCALAVINMNKVPRDREFFNELLDSVTIALRDAAIRQDIEELTRVIRGV